MAAAVNPPARPGPRGWEQCWPATMWRFKRYRSHRQHRPPDAAQYEQYRDVWENMPLPPGGPLRRTGEIASPMEKRYIANWDEGPSLDGPWPPNPNTKYIETRRRRDEARTFFLNIQDLQYLRTLGAGGNGLAMLYRHQPQQGGAQQDPLQFVIKVSKFGWENSGIRHEERNTKKMARAAHSIQLIPRERFGLPESEKFAFEVVPADDSDEPRDSSGEESRDDRPTAEAKEKRTRKEIRRANGLETLRKRNSHKARMIASKAARQERNRRVRRAKGQDSRGQGPIGDPWELNRRDFLMLEYCRYGDLESLIKRVSGRNMVFPNRVLWSFWLCMVRACLGMQYPPRKFHPRRREGPPEDMGGQPGVSTDRLGKVVGTDLFEEVPDPRKRWAQKRIVHFDIDPKNIFITGLDALTRDEEHKLVPRLKLADFGLAAEIKPRKNKYAQLPINTQSELSHIHSLYYYKYRSQTKFGYYAPEQFCRDWEYIVQDEGRAVMEDGPEVSEQRVAGNYGPAMNVWGIGLVMWQLMTGMMPPVPPQLQAKRGLHANLPYNYCALLLTDADYGCYDLELRQIVARCMAAEPQQRPTLMQLLRGAKKGIEKRFDGETDESIRAFVQEFIYNG
ncbi:kinase-like domain-containing protein [Xylaria sp. FL0933]|nr:kinase-like domain-containing protein [Xylaria sp. FL0933]